MASEKRERGLTIAASVALAGALLGVVFAAYSTSDYMAHLDRQVHAIHCSFIPGASPSSDEANPCKAALFSPYSAIFRQTYWGGIPISLAALGCFSFFAGLAIYLLVARARASRQTIFLFALTSLAPLGASIVMFAISLTQLHAFCKLCVGIYTSSLLVAIGGALAFRARGDHPKGKAFVLPAGLVAFGAASLLPVLVYVGSLPDYKPLLTSCGALTNATESHGALLKLPTTQPKRPVMLFEDPLCPTCKAFHERLVMEGMLEKLDITLSLFPLDSECNWMLDRSLHPGACVLSRAVICGKDRSRVVLEWAYDNQEDLRPLGKQGGSALKDRIVKQFPDVASCIDDKVTIAKLNQQLQFAASNHIPVSTPQFYLKEGDKLGRVCDEDTDLGLRYAMGQLAPEVLPQ